MRWRLHFEFVTANMNIDENNIEIGQLDVNGDWHAPVDMEIETMVWNLPVTLYPTAPMPVLQQPSKYTAVIK